MLFLGIIMMPFYYISKTHSVPGYLKLRFGEPSRLLAAVSFGIMTVLMSGINMYSMALVMRIILGWDINFSIWVASITVAAYVFLGGLLSAIFNEVLQFFLIWLGAIVISILGLIEAGGWSGMVARIHHNFPGQDYTHMWAGLGSFTANPMGINWVGRARPWVCHFLRILDHRFPGCPARPCRTGSAQRQDGARDRCRLQNGRTVHCHPSRFARPSSPSQKLVGEETQAAMAGATLTTKSCLSCSRAIAVPVCWAWASPL